MRKKKTEETTQEIETPIEEDPIIVDETSSVGSILKAARKKRGDSVEKIANFLRIRSCYLKALEESKYEDFPGHTYAIGFLRGYAFFLGLDVDKLVEKYRQETSYIKPAEIEMPICEQHSLFPSIKYLFWAVAVIILVWFFWYFLTYKETQVELPVFISQEPTLSEQITKEEIVINEPVQEEKKVVQETKTSQKAKKGSVQIVALEEVWVEIEQDDTLILSRTLKKGETYDVPESKVELFLKTGNAGGMDILVDGQKVKRLGPVGAVRSGISLSPDKLKKR